MLSHAPLNWPIITAFFFLLFALPPVSRGLASIYIFRFTLPRPGFGKRLSRRDEIADVFSFLFFFIPPGLLRRLSPAGGGGPRLRVRKFSSPPPAAFTRSPMAWFCRGSFLDGFFAFSFDLNPFNQINSRAGRDHFWVEARCPTTAGYYFFIFFFCVSCKDLAMTFPSILKLEHLSRSIQSF